MITINNINYYCSVNPEVIIEKFKIDLFKKQQSLSVVEKLLPDMLDNTNISQMRVEYFK
jgi:hypothetical protein